MHIPEKQLFLAYTRQDVASIIDTIRALKNRSQAFAVVGADYSAWAELRRSKIDFKTPSEYFSGENCARIDAEAARLARSWYKNVERKLSYHTISLAEMVQYDFVHCFIDALRSIEIASAIMDTEQPSHILLPRHWPIRKPNSVRYESLPSCLAHFADLSGTKATYYKSTERRSSKERLGEIAKLYRVSNLIVREALSPARNPHHLDNAVFLDFPERVFSRIKEHLRNRNVGLVVNMKPIERILARSRIRARLHGSQSYDQVELDEAWLRTGLDYEDLSLIELMSNRFYDFLENQCALLSAYVDGTERLIKDMDPGVVVLREDVSPIMRTIAKTFKINGTPTMVIQHGITGVDIGGIHVMPVEADVQAVWGERTRDWSILNGKPADSQVITGNPAYDLIVSTTPMIARSSKIYKTLRLNKEKGIVVIATNWYQPVSSCYTPEQDLAFIMKTLTAMKKFHDKQIVVKLHPAYSREYREIVKDSMRELGIQEITVTSRFLWELLYLCDLLITQTSGVALEAMLLDKPVVIMETRGMESSYSRSEGFVHADGTVEEIASAIENTLYNEELRIKLAKERKRTVYAYAYKQDDGASERVACLIVKLMRNKKRISGIMHV